MKEYNYIAGTLGLIMLCVTLFSCSNDSVVTSTGSYPSMPLNEIVWNGDNGEDNSGGTTTAPCRSTELSTACPGTGITTDPDTGGTLQLTSGKTCSWVNAGRRQTLWIKEDSLDLSLIHI